MARHSSHSLRLSRPCPMQSLGRDCRVRLPTNQRWSSCPRRERYCQSSTCTARGCSPETHQYISSESTTATLHTEICSSLACSTALREGSAYLDSDLAFEKSRYLSLFCLPWPMTFSWTQSTPVLSISEELMRFDLGTYPYRCCPRSSHLISRLRQLGSGVR